MVVCLVADHLKRVHPLRGDCLVPVDFLHACFHLSEHGLEVFPLLSLFNQNLFCRRNAHGCKEVEALRRSSLGGVVVIVDHLLQHLGVGLIALRHQTYLIMAGHFELRTDAGLLFADFIEVLLDGCDGVGIAQQLPKGLPYFLYFGLHLWNAQVVGTAHEIVEQHVQLVIVLLCILFVVQCIGHYNGAAQTDFLVQTEGYAL